VKPPRSIGRKDLITRARWDLTQYVSICDPIKWRLRLERNHCYLMRPLLSLGRMSDCWRGREHPNVTGHIHHCLGNLGVEQTTLENEQ
jgi:hypothetical protein